MDPSACLERLINAMNTGDWSDADEASSDLHNWLLRGGFAPTVNNLQMIALLSYVRKLLPYKGYEPY